MSLVYAPCRTASEEKQFQDLKAARRRIAAAGKSPEPSIVIIRLPPPAAIEPPEPDFEELADGYPTIKSIQLAVCHKFQVSRAHLVGNQRTKDVIAPRHIAFAICAELTVRSLPEIGLMFGGKDHTTVMHGRNRMRPLAANVRQKLGPENTSVRDWVSAMFEELKITRPDSDPRTHKKSIGAAIVQPV